MENTNIGRNQVMFNAKQKCRLNRSNQFIHSLIRAYYIQLDIQQQPRERVDQSSLRSISVYAHGSMGTTAFIHVRSSSKR